MTYSQCVVYLLVFQCSNSLCLGLVSALLVFPHAMDMFSGVLGASFISLAFTQTGDLFSDLVGVLFILLVFQHTSHLFSDLVGMSFINLSKHKHPAIGHCRRVCVNYIFYSYLLYYI